VNKAALYDRCRASRPRFGAHCGFLTLEDEGFQCFIING
jgi:hypothetical protein